MIATATRRLVYPLPSLPRVIARTMTATHLNEVANHPDVRPWLGGDGAIDLTAMIADPANLACVTDAGGFVCVAHGHGRYEVHSLFLPEGRGREAIQTMRTALDYLFASSDATEVVTKVPVTNLPAAGLARLAGFETQFTSQALWRSTERTMIDFMNLTLDRWVARSVVLPSFGVWLHEQMEHAKAALRSTLGPHSDEDAMHDRIAGAALLMIRAGNVRKAEWAYNRWAQFTGFPGIRVLRDLPCVIDLGGLVIEVRANEAEVLSCQ